MKDSKKSNFNAFSFRSCRLALIGDNGESMGIPTIVCKKFC